MRVKMRRKVTSVSRIPRIQRKGWESGHLYLRGLPSILHCSPNICSPNSSAEKCRVQKDLPLVRTISYSNCSPSPCGEWGSLRGGSG